MKVGLIYVDIMFQYFSCLASEQNGENVKENVDANSTENWVSFSYQNEFESMVEYFLDFKNVGKLNVEV